MRERYVRTFTKVMSAVSEQLGTDKHIQMMAELAVEQPNLTKLLKQVDSVKEDTYKFFIKMATDCTLVIEKYMAGRDKYWTRNGDCRFFYCGGGGVNERSIYGTLHPRMTLVTPSP